ncbi:MAG: transglutaminase domain-containing protein, partial [Chlorobi bacterium]|nr:transglutaminase domain-containing protein [Chlorobiota bacterium]
KIIANHKSHFDIINKLFLYVRDKYVYNPFKIDLSRESLKASSIMKRPSAYCVEKAILLCALLRVANIPCRLHFGNVKNHVLSEKLEKALKTDEMVFHGSVGVYYNHKWLKITPAFNKSLCYRLGVAALEFNGKTDSLFQQFNKSGSKFIEYTHDYGSFTDLPYDLYLKELLKYYPHIAYSDTLKIDLSNFS